MSVYTVQTYYGPDDTTTTVHEDKSQAFVLLQERIGWAIENGYDCRITLYCGMVILATYEQGAL